MKKRGQSGIRICCERQKIRQQGRFRAWTALGALLLTAAWWNAFLPAFFPETNSFRLYAGLVVSWAVLTAADQWTRGKTIIPALVIAGVYLWASRDTGPALPEAAAALSAPVMELYLAAGRRKRLRGAVVLTALIPYITSALSGFFPPFAASWFLLMALTLYLFFCGVDDAGRYEKPGMEKEIVRVFCMVLALCVLFGICALTGRLLDRERDVQEGFYQTARERIRSDIIGGIEKTARNLSGADHEDNAGGEKEQGNVQENVKANRQESSRGEVEESAQGDTGEVTQENIEDSAGLLTEGGSGRTESAMGNLRAAASFVPDGDNKQRIILPEKPDGTVYLAERIGVVYTGGSWEEIPEDENLSQAGTRQAIQPEDCQAYPDGLDRMRDLCSQWRGESLWDVQKQISDTLSSMAVYDTRPGPTPDNQDFAEYFLFEKHRGFCVHFATAAVLLYRMCGYPARYVEGFAVPASAFEPWPDGRYAAQIDGSMGHAWCQVYDETAGEWLDMEHTPAAGTNGPDGAANRSSQGALLPEGENISAMPVAEVIKWALTAGGGILAFLAVFFLQAAVRRRRMYRRMLIRKGGRGILLMYQNILKTALFQSGRGKAFSDLFQGDEPEKTAVFARKKCDLDGISPAVIERLKSVYPEIEAKDWEWIYDKVMEALFYYPEEERKALEEMRSLYRKFVHTASGEMGYVKRVVWKYILCLG